MVAGVQVCSRCDNFCCKIAEAEAVVSVNANSWLVMHMYVQVRLDDGATTFVLFFMCSGHADIQHDRCCCAGTIPFLRMAHENLKARDESS